MPSAPSTFSNHSVARCASPALPPAPRAIAGMPRAIGTFAWGHARRPVAQELNLHAQRRRAGGAATVLVVGGALERGAHGDIELCQGAGILAPEVQVEPCLLRDRVESRAAPEPHDGASSTRRLLRGEVGEQRCGAPHGIRRVGDAERCP